jgi:hypothetical protein
MAGERRGVVAVVGDEDVVAMVAVEVGDEDLATVLCARGRAVPHRRAVHEPTLTVAEVDADRKRLMRNRTARDAGDDEVVTAIAVQVSRLDLGQIPDP